ncbi:MAG: porphobilinogen synthase, partial [Euryarchaeota archaeon]|nr:porphobilinogen synthase [Euryarchaeota archaeon]
MVRRARKGGSRPDGPGAAPIARPRRWRRSSALREVIAEQDTELRRLVYPLFVSAGGALRGPEGLPALARRNVEGTVREAEDAFRRGVRSVLLFGIPARKDAQGTSAFDPKGPVPSAIRALKTRLPDLVVMADVCLCEYTSHGHCGVLSDGAVDNDRTLPLLGQAAVAYAGAGADVVAPSSMMDHQVAALRRALHDAGQEDTL